MVKANHNLRLVHALPREPKEIGSVLDLIGNTPLLEIRKITEGLPAGVRIFAKLEGFNPGGSVKDRPALRMIQQGIQRRNSNARQSHSRFNLRQHRHRLGVNR